MDCGRTIHLSQFHLPELGVDSAAFRNHHPLCSGARHAKGRRRLSCRRIWRRSKSLSAIGSFARLSSARPTSWPSTVSICGTSIPQMKRKGWQSPLVIAQFHRRRCRSEPIRVGGGERTEQKNSAVADTKLPSQYGKLFQLNRGIQIEFRESPPISPRHKDDWLKTRILGENDSF